MDLAALWQVGVDAVRGDAAVRQSLTTSPIDTPGRIIAVGKAASAMARPACEIFPGVPCLIVTKYDHSQDAPPGADVIESAHPVPDAQSLAAGSALREAVRSCETGCHLLVLVSGGASALAEALPEGMDLADLTRETQTLLGSGADIHAMNARRREISQIKGGKLLAGFDGRITTLAISDVEGDALSVIGSGIGVPPEGHEVRIVASNAIARAAISDTETPVVNEESLYDDFTCLAPRMGAALRDGPPGFYLWGGEPTVVLPERPGKGGRNMALALALAKEIKGHDIEVLVAGTDGTDGPTDAAGAFVNGESWDADAATALDTANAYPYFDQKGALFRPGPTGTNVMDLVLAVKR